MCACIFNELPSKLQFRIIFHESYIVLCKGTENYIEIEIKVVNFF